MKRINQIKMKQKRIQKTILQVQFWYYINNGVVLWFEFSHAYYLENRTDEIRLDSQEAKRHERTDTFG